MEVALLLASSSRHSCKLRAHPVASTCLELREVICANEVTSSLHAGRSSANGSHPEASDHTRTEPS